MCILHLNSWTTPERDLKPLSSQQIVASLFWGHSLAGTVLPLFINRTSWHINWQSLVQGHADYVISIIMLALSPVETKLRYVNKMANWSCIQYIQFWCRQLLYDKKLGHLEKDRCCTQENYVNFNRMNKLYWTCLHFVFRSVPYDLLYTIW